MLRVNALGAFPFRCVRALSALAMFCSRIRCGGICMLQLSRAGLVGQARLVVHRGGAGQAEPSFSSTSKRSDYPCACVCAGLKGICKRCGARDVASCSFVASDIIAVAELHTLRMPEQPAFGRERDTHTPVTGTRHNLPVVLQSQKTRKPTVRVAGTSLLSSRGLARGHAGDVRGCVCVGKPHGLHRTVKPSAHPLQPASALESATSATPQPCPHPPARNAHSQSHTQLPRRCRRTAQAALFTSQSQDHTSNIARN